MKQTSALPLPDLCPVCAGHRFKRKKLYPEFKYCRKHGIRMHPFDFSQFEPLFNAMSNVHFFLLLCDMHHMRPIFSPNAEVSMDMVQVLTDVSETFSKLKGVYYE